VANKKGKNGKEQAGIAQSISPTTNTRKALECTHPTKIRVKIKKKRKKETIPRALVLGIEHAEGTNRKDQKKDNIPKVESGDLPEEKIP
jgi:hypothetical protein